MPTKGLPKTPKGTAKAPKTPAAPKMPKKKGGVAPALGGGAKKSGTVPMSKAAIRGLKISQNKKRNGG